MKITTPLTFIVKHMFGNNFEYLQSYEVVHRTAKNVAAHVSSVCRINELMTMKGLTYAKACAKDKVFNVCGKVTIK